jgi:hypothetical protein
MKKHLTLGVAVLAATIIAGSAEALDRTKVRAFVQEKQAAVVTLEVVIDMKSNQGGQSNESERKFDALATIVDEQGMAVAALSTIDPGSFYAKMSGEEETFTSQVRSLKYVLPDNTEVEVGVVLRDPDLDLVFLKPLTAPGKAMTFIDLNSGSDGENFEAAYTIARTGRVARRTALTMSGEVQGIVSVPRRYYIPSSELVSARTGTPVFAEDNALLGITAMTVFPGGAKARGEEDQPYTYIIVPTDQVLDGAKQAKEGKPEVPAPTASEPDSPEPVAPDAAAPATSN